MAEVARKRTRGKVHFNTRKKVKASKLVGPHSSKHGRRKRLNESRNTKAMERVMDVMSSMERQRRHEAKMKAQANGGS